MSDSVSAGDHKPVRTSKELSSFVSQVAGQPVERSQQIQSLWAGYGKLCRLFFSKGETKEQKKNRDSGKDILSTCVAKLVTPPSTDGSISHARKLRSYEVEAAFYSEVRPMLPLHLCRVAKPIRLAAWDDGARVLVLEDLRTEFSKSANTRCILRWLAAFHAVFYERADLRKLPVWKQGCYWHLETRPDELAAMDVSDPFFARLKKAAPQLDGILSEGPGLTLLHGDAKHPNFLADPCGAVAAVDFQYCGIGQPMKDVAYLLDDTQEDAKVSELLKEYGEAFYRAREEFGLPQLEESLEAFVERQERMFDVAAADLLRFLAGWGFWGHTERQRRRAEPLLARLLE